MVPHGIKGPVTFFNGEDLVLFLIQIFLPLYDNDKRRFPGDMYRGVTQELTCRFGGLTRYMRAPVEGLWKDNSADAKKDDLVIYEVMAPELDKQWWSTYRHGLEKHFQQAEILVRAQSVELL